MPPKEITAKAKQHGDSIYRHATTCLLCHRGNHTRPNWSHEENFSCELCRSIWTVSPILCPLDYRVVPTVQGWIERDREKIEIIKNGYPDKHHAAYYICRIFNHCMRHARATNQATRSKSLPKGNTSHDLGSQIDLKHVARQRQDSCKPGG